MPCALAAKCTAHTNWFYRHLALALSQSLWLQKNPELVQYNLSILDPSVILFPFQITFPFLILFLSSKC